MMMALCTSVGNLVQGVPQQLLGARPNRCTGHSSRPTRLLTTEMILLTARVAELMRIVLLVGMSGVILWSSLSPLCRPRVLRALLILVLSSLASSGRVLPRRCRSMW